MKNKSLEVVRKVKDVKEEVSPDNTGNAPEEEAASELGPTIGCLQLIRLLLAAGQGQGRGSGWISFIEGCNAIYGQTNAQYNHKPSSCQRPSTSCVRCVS